METDGYYAPLTEKHSFQPYPAWRIVIGTLPSGEWASDYYNLFHPQGARGYQRRYHKDESGALASARDFGCAT